MDDQPKTKRIICDGAESHYDRLSVLNRSNALNHLDAL